jgi:hypothetical protein
VSPQANNLSPASGIFAIIVSLPGAMFASLLLDMCKPQHIAMRMAEQTFRWLQAPFSAKFGSKCVQKCPSEPSWVSVAPRDTFSMVKPGSVAGIVREQGLFVSHD